MSEIHPKSKLPDRTDRFLVKLKDGTICTADFENLPINPGWNFHRAYRIEWWMEIPEVLKKK